MKYLLGFEFNSAIFIKMALIISVIIERNPSTIVIDGNHYDSKAA